MGRKQSLGPPSERRDYRDYADYPSLPVIALGQVGRAEVGASKKTPLHTKRYIMPNETNLCSNPMAANSDYHKRILDRAPFGTRLWWRVYHSYPRN